MWLCKTPDGWKRYPVLMAKNGRVRTGYVIAGGKEEHYPEGRFQIRVKKEGKRTWENAGDDAGEALNERARLSLRREAQDKAEAAGTQLVEEPGRIAIRPAVTRYLQRCNDLEAEQAAYSTPS